MLYIVDQFEFYNKNNVGLVKSWKSLVDVYPPPHLPFLLLFNSSKRPLQGHIDHKSLINLLKFTITDLKAY